MKVREAIQTFLKARSADSPFLIDLWRPSLETQIMVHPGSTEEAPGVYVADGEKWSNIRWPYQAGTRPNFTDREITFSPGSRVSKVGSTWWDWEAKESVAVGFDIDATDSGHAVGTNQLDEFKLGNIVAKLSEIPFVNLVRSTGGKGVHAYVFFDDKPKTENHNEHTQVALQVLEKIKADYGVDLIGDSIVDVKGVILWFWASSSPSDHPGFTVIKQAEYNLNAADVEGWQELAKVRSVKVSPTQSTELEEEHLRILAELEDSGFSYRWIQGRQMAHTHTRALKIVHDKLGLRGVYETVSRGSDPTTPNCYIVPKPGGVFKVNRFGNSDHEHECWHKQDGDRWIYFNQDTEPFALLTNYADIVGHSSIQMTEESLKRALSLMGKDGGLPEIPWDVKGDLTVELDHQKGSLVVTAAAMKSIPPGWTKSKRGNKMFFTLEVKTSKDMRGSVLLDQLDSKYRFVVTPDGDSWAWMHKSNVGWISAPSSHQVTDLLDSDYGAGASKELVPLMKMNPWRLTNRPFEPEELPGRLLNHRAACFCCEPSSVPGGHPHFDLILDHVGCSLDSVILNLDWCSEWNIHCGADYLRYWIASAVKHPFEPLPYLFLFGGQGSGKSIFFEMLSLLFPNAVCNLSSAMTNSSSFNAEMKSAVFGYVDEKDLNSKGQGETAYGRIKEWVTARTLTVHEKGKTPYQQPNTIKLIQCSNKIDAIRIDRDDTRVVAINVPQLSDPIPKSVLEARLVEESAFFLRTILTTEIPAARERLRVPHISTEDNLALGEMSMSTIQRWACDHLMFCPGQSVPLDEFRERYSAFAMTKGYPPAVARVISVELQKLPDRMLIGRRGKDNLTHLGNVCWKDKKLTPGKKLRLLGSRLV